MKQIKNIRSTELGNSLLTVAVLIGLAAVLGTLGFFLWNRLQQEKMPGQTAPEVSNATTPSPTGGTPTTEATSDPSVKEVQTTTDLDAYLSDLDKTNINSLDSPQ